MAALLDAVKDRDRDKVRLLLEDGANVNEQDGSGRTALYFSAQKGLVDITRLLLSYGALAWQQTHWLSTPLHVAADKGFDEMLRVLATTGTNLNLQNKNGDTALHLAAYRGKIGAVRVLVEEGASVLLANSEGRTPLEDAEVNGHEEVVVCLRQAAEAQTRQAERLMAVQPRVQQHWEVSGRPRPQQQHPSSPYMEPFQSPARDRWSHPRAPVMQPQRYPLLISQQMDRQPSPIAQQPINWQHAAMAQRLPPDQFPLQEEPSPFHNWPMQQPQPPFRPQRFPLNLSERPVETTRVYIPQIALQQDPSVRPLSTRVVRDSPYKQPVLPPPWEHIKPEVGRIASVAGRESSGRFETSVQSNGQHSSLLEKAEVESNNDRHGRRKGVMELRRQQSEHEQLEYKNRMLNETLERQMERLSDVDKLEEKNKALMDELDRVREENESLMKSCNDLVRQNADRREPAIYASPSESAPIVRMQRQRSLSVVEISGQRLSEVASAVIGGNGLLPVAVEERLTRLILSDISECSGINYMSDSETVQHGTGHLPAVKGDALCEEGLEWIYNVDYWLREDDPLNRPKDGMREGACSLVFRIEHKRHGKLILKVMINLINMYSAGHGSGQSMTAFLAGHFGAEHDVPLQLPKHPNIVQILHHFHGSTRPFNQFLRYMVPPHFDVHLEQANKTTFMVMKEYACTLSLFTAQMKEANPTPPYALEQNYVLCLLFQLASAINHLLQYGVCHRDIKADNVFLDESHWKVVLADFGLARTLYRGGPRAGKPIQFVETGQMIAGNSNAWAPEIVRSYKQGPPLDRDVFLPEVYAKTDVYGLGRMCYQLLCHPDDEFPSGSNSYIRDSLPALPAVFSPNVRGLLEGMVSYDPDERLSARDVEVCSGLLLFGPQCWEMTTEQACSKWHSQQIFKSSLESGACKEEGKDSVMKELLSRLLFTTSPGDIHMYVNKLKLF